MLDTANGKHILILTLRIWTRGLNEQYFISLWILKSKVCLYMLDF